MAAQKQAGKKKPSQQARAGDAAAPSKRKLWIAAARVRTLPLAVSPVVAGAGLAATAHSFSPLLTLCAFTVSVLLQIGVNYANDYSDGIRGTDDNRVGPARLTASGAVPARQVLRAALLCFAAAAAAGLAAVILSGKWWFLLLGVAAIIAAWFYTGGKRPYGYSGFGEVAVFIFFGIVATAGTYFLQSDTLMQEIWWAAAAIGMFAVAVLLANNTRDIATDRAAGKHTLAVRIGERWSRLAYVGCVLLPFGLPLAYMLFYPGLVMLLGVLFIVLPACIIMLTAKTAREMILVLQLTSYASLTFAVLLAVGFNA